MDNNKHTQDFDLEDILKEFGSGKPLPKTEEPEAQPVQEVPAPEAAEAAAPEAPAESEAEAAEEIPEETPAPAEDAEEESSQEAPVSEDVPQEEAVTGDTIRLDKIADAVANAGEEAAPEAPAEENPSSEEAAPEGDTVTFEPPVEGDAASAEGNTVAFDPPMEELNAPPPIIFRPRSRLRELKKKLIAGPEKRYYELSEYGLGRLQIAMIVNFLIVLLCAGATAMYAADIVPENRMRLLIFSQILAMLVSATLASHCMIDSVADLFKGKFTLNFMMVLTFIACCADAVFCLIELRVPCCAAFSLEVSMSLWNRYQQRNTEMGQMDTMRKAVRLDSLVKTDDFFEGKPGILRGEGQVEDFMDTYTVTTGPEKVQAVFAIVSLLVCVGISVLTGVLHGVSLAVQILSTSLLVAVPASFFVSLSRPMAILERRLHMVGTVLCGWKGVKGLCGKAAFPLTDEDIFPTGAAKLNGVKYYGDRKPEDVIAYTSALIRTCGGCLAPIFSQLLKSRGGIEYDVENFRNYGGGGIGGEVCGEPVLLGTSSFLQDMGVEVPEGTMVNQAIYVSIDGQFCAVFAISYSKMKSSAAGLVTLCSYRKLTPVLVCDDFMLTETFLRSKFSIKTRRFAFPEREVRRELAARKPEPDTPVLALTTQDGLAATAYAVTGSRALRTASNLGLIIHMAGGILGLLIMLVLAILGSAELLTPANVLLFQLIWMVPGLLVTEWTRAV